MTSKNLFFKRLRQDLDQRIWLPIVLFLVMFLFMELPLINSLETILQRQNATERLYEYLLNSFFAPDSEFVWLTVAAAFVSGLSSFAFLNSSRQLDVYHSLPIRREWFFTWQYVYGILYYLGVIVIHTAISFGIAVANGMPAGALISYALWFVPVQLVIYLAVYSTTVAGVCLTGNLVINALGSGILLVYSAVLDALRGSMMAQFFVTYYHVEGSFAIPAFAPVHLLVNYLNEAMTGSFEEVFYTDYMSFYGKFLLMAVCYGVFAFLLYRRRPSEAAGGTMVFSWTEAPIKTLLVLPATLFAGYIFMAISYGGHDRIWFIAGCAMSFLIFCPLVEILYRKDVKAAFRHPMQLAFNGICTAAIVLILLQDLFGYDAYIPAEEQVDSYGVYMYELASVNGRYGSLVEDQLKAMELRDNESLRALLEYAARITRPARTEDSLDTPEMLLSEEALSSPDSSSAREEACYYSLDVKYRLKSGREIYRNYLVNGADPQVMAWLGGLYEDPAFKTVAYPVLDTDREHNYTGVLLTYAYGSQSLPLTARQMEDFVEVYSQELEALALKEITEEYPLVRLSFALGKDTQESDGEYTVAVAATREAASVDSQYDEFRYYGEESGYYIYPSFTRTLALLEELGAVMVNQPEPESVTRIRIVDESREVNDQDGLLTKNVEVEYSQESGQTEEIAQILPGVQVSHLQGAFFRFRETEEYIDVVVYYHSQEGYEDSCYGSFRKGEMPAFVREDLAASS